ncbi:hypothetical protein B0H13DRAFT_1854994 [Mycena leptocephala]|nr:hypothetical protein B0H13DRAFT_1854994 [Mycena leptocephala]
MASGLPPSSLRPPPLRQTEASKARRRREYPMDDHLDFNTQILVMLWLKDDENPLKLVLYPREDLRVRLSDYKVVLAEAGLEQTDLKLHVYVADSRGVQGAWIRCAWDAPLRVHGAGDGRVFSPIGK